MQCYVQQDIYLVFSALGMGFPYRWVLMLRRMEKCLVQLIPLSLWVYGRHRSLDQTLIHGYTKVLHVWKPDFVAIIVEMVAANHRILRRARPVCPGKLHESNPSCSLSLIFRENVHRDSVRLSLTATSYNTHPSFAFTGHYEKKITTELNKFCIENGANDVSWRHFR